MSEYKDKVYSIGESKEKALHETAGITSLGNFHTVTSDMDDMDM